MSFQKQKIAGAALAISFLGTGATYFSGGFLGSLLHHGFLASLIGGFADWFAVVALFRKPLGISYRTEILKHNKTRIMNELVDFVVHDILSSENIMRVLKKENMASLSVSYLKERGGKKRVIYAVSEILSIWFQNIDTKKISKNLTPSVKEGLFVFFEKENVNEILNIFIKNDKQTLTVLTNIAEEIFKLESFQNELKKNIKEAIDEYVGDSIGRSMLIGFLDLNEDTVLEKIKTEFLNKMKGIKSYEGESYETAKLSLNNFAENIKNSKEFELKLGQIKEYTNKNLFVDDIVEDILKSQINDEKLKKIVEEFLLNKLNEFEESEDLQNEFDVWIKNFIREAIDKNHNLIENLVRERLNELNEDEFSDFVEGKVNDDLQMIRVNGAIVGGFVGMILYVITFLATRFFEL